MPRVHHKYNSAKFNTEYSTWYAMKRRCFNEDCPEFPNYGARGITVCGRWLGDEGFDNFVDDMGKRPDGCSIDRIDVNGDYCPENCRWADLLTQNNNRRTNRYITINGRTQTIMEWARETGLLWDTIHDRIERGWAESRILSKDNAKYTMVTIDGETHPIKYWCEHYNIPRSTFFFRLQRGWEGQRLLLPSRPKSPNGQGKRRKKRTPI